MLIFIDDSGDPGFKLDRGSSQYFLIALVIFDDSLEAEKAAVAIKEYRRSLGFSDQEEFKFNKSSNPVRVGFLETINKITFRVRFLVVDKSIIYSRRLKTDKDSFYSYAIKQVLKNSANTITDARIRIDGSGDRIFRKNFNTYLRRELNQSDKKIMKNCKLVDSKSDVLVQMADMIAGAIRRSYDDNKKENKLFRNIIEKHIEDAWEFQ